MCIYQTNWVYSNKDQGRVYLKCNFMAPRIGCKFKIMETFDDVHQYTAHWLLMYLGVFMQLSSAVGFYLSADEIFCRQEVNVHVRSLILGRPLRLVSLSYIRLNNYDTSVSYTKILVSWWYSRLLYIFIFNAWLDFFKPRNPLSTVKACYWKKWTAIFTKYIQRENKEKRIYQRYCCSA